MLSRILREGKRLLELKSRSLWAKSADNARVVLKVDAKVLSEAAAEEH